MLNPNFIQVNNESQSSMEMIESSEVKLKEKEFNVANLNQFDIQLFKKRSLKILIVDDEQYNIDALKIILKYHCNVDSDSICDTAFDGKQALEAVQKNVDQYQGLFCEYELIFMDCNMPIMDGYEATNLIR